MGDEMSYFNMDHAEWMERATKRTLTPFQKRVVTILGIVGSGIYNAPINPSKINWDWGKGVSVVWKRDLCTWDFNNLTLLVVLCHEARIRLEVDTAGPVGIRLSFWQRKSEGGISERHPSIDEAVESFRKHMAEDHVLYGWKTETTAN